MNQEEKLCTSKMSSSVEKLYRSVMLIRKPLLRASTFVVSEREMNFVPLKTIRAKARTGEEAPERVHSWT